MSFSDSLVLQAVYLNGQTLSRNEWTLLMAMKKSYNAFNRLQRYKKCECVKHLVCQLACHHF